MTLQASLQQFITALKILQEYDISKVRNNLQNMNTHQALAQGVHQDNMKQLRLTLAHYKKAESQLTYQKTNIQADVQPWVPVVTSYQETSVYKTSLTSSVSQIIQSKKSMDAIDNTLNELQIKVTFQAKNAKTSFDNLDRIEQQIFVLQLALDLNDFMDNSHLSASGIADFEFQKYYDLYMRGGN